MAAWHGRLKAPQRYWHAGCREIATQPQRSALPVRCDMMMTVLCHEHSVTTLPLQATDQGPVKSCDTQMFTIQSCSGQCCSTVSGELFRTIGFLSRNLRHQSSPLLGFPRGSQGGIERSASSNQAPGPKIDECG